MTKTMIISENVGKVTREGKFPSAVCRKGVGSNSILCQFCKYGCIGNVVVLEVS